MNSRKLDSTDLAPDALAFPAAREGMMRRTFIGGCAGCVYPAIRYSRRVGGCAGWVEA